MSTRSRFKKGQRLAAKNKERQAILKGLGGGEDRVEVVRNGSGAADSPTCRSPTPDRNAQESVAGSAYPAAQNKKCKHLKAGVKLKNLSNWSLEVHQRSCSVNNCTAQQNNWVCLSCVHPICNEHRALHDHPITLRPLRSADVENAFSNDSISLYCMLCEAEISPEKNLLLVDALVAIRKAFERATSKSISEFDRLTNDLSRVSLSFQGSNSNSASGRRLRACVKSKSAPYDLCRQFGVRGLHNLGNTCYANSLLQVLAHAGLKWEPTTFDSNDPSWLEQPSIAHVGKVASCLGSLLNELRWNGDANSNSPGGFSVSPHEFMDQVVRKHKQFADMGQNDSSELMHCLLEDLDRESKQCLTIVGMPKSLTTLWAPSRPFQSQLISSLKCNTCGKASEVREVFFDFPVDVTHSLTASIAKFFSRDTVIYKCRHVNSGSPALCEGGGANDTSDNGCPYKSANEDGDDEKGEGEPALHEKEYRVQTLGQILCFQLRRTARTKKVKVSVPAKLSICDLGPRMPRDLASYGKQGGEDIGNGYELFGLVQHNGTLNFGHYIAYVKPLGHSSESESWFLMNDSEVHQVNEAQALGSNPYLVFYRRSS